MKSISRTSLCLFVFLLFVVNAQGQIAITTVDGNQVQGELQAWNNAGVEIAIDGEVSTFSTDQLLRVGLPASENQASPALFYVEFTDGTQLPVSKYEVSQRQATVTTSLAAEPLSIPVSAVSRVRLHSDAAQQDALWAELEEKQLSGDILVIHKKKTSSLDYLAGVLGNISESKVDFSWDGDEIPVSRSKVAALAYYHAQPPEPAPPLCWLSTIDDAYISVASITLEKDLFLVVTSGGIELQLSKDAIQNADYSAGKVVYLSDLEPIRQSWVPLIEFPAGAEFASNYGSLKKDQSYTGSTLALAWLPSEESQQADPSARATVKSYAKGLALRSRTELEYRLPAGMQRFVTTAGIDPQMAAQGTVELSISADGQTLWQGNVVGGEQPIEIEVNVKDARRLQILVDYGENLDFGDRLHLVDARVIK